MKLLIAGSRKFSDYSTLIETLKKYPYLDSITEIVSGGAIGTDQLGERAAKDLGIPIKQFLPEYDKYSGKQAPIMRNKLMAEYADQAIIFWDGESRGTANMMQEMGKRNKFIYLCNTKHK